MCWWPCYLLAWMTGIVVGCGLATVVMVVATWLVLRRAAP